MLYKLAWTESCRHDMAAKWHEKYIEHMEARIMVCFGLVWFGLVGLGLVEFVLCWFGWAWFGWSKWLEKYQH